MAVAAALKQAEAHDAPIDLVHLARMTLGERSLEREVLQLFRRQASMLIARMRGVEPAGAGGLAHTLNGSARGIGAWRAARAAEAVEIAATAGDASFAAACRELEDAVEEACAFIGELLNGN